MNSPGAYSVVQKAELPAAPAAAKSILRLIGGLLKIAAPAAAERSARLHEIIGHCIAAEADAWIYEAVAQLEPLGGLALPEAPFALLAEIPRFDNVAAILRDDPHGGSDPETVATGIALLRVARAVDERRTRGMAWEALFSELRMMPEALLPRFVDALHRIYAPAEVSVPTEDLPLGKLRVGMVCAEEVLASSGSVIVPKNAVLHALTLERLRRFADGAGVREPVRVFLEEK